MGQVKLSILAIQCNSICLGNFLINYIKSISAQDFKILAFSVVINLGLFVLSETLRRLLGLKGSFNRKFIHVCVAMWGVSAFFIFQSKEAAVILPVLFILSNVRFIRSIIFKVARIEGVHHSGTIYYPIAMFLLIWFCWESNERWAGIIGMLNLGLGDSFAAVIGGHFGKAKYKIGECSKTYLGSLVMFIISFAVSLVVIGIKNNGFGLYGIGASATIAMGATFFEAYGGNGLDNLSVPLGSAFIYSLFYS